MGLLYLGLEIKYLELKMNDCRFTSELLLIQFNIKKETTEEFCKIFAQSLEFSPNLHH